jgi:hypothetical protein
MDAKEEIYWVDNFTLLSLCSILRLTSFDFRGIKIIYHKSSRFYIYIFRLITTLFFEQVETEKARFSLGNMKSEKGEALRYEIEEMSGRAALEMVKAIKKNDIYQSVKNMLPFQKLDVYITKAIKSEIYMVITTLCIINWHLRNGETGCHTIVWTENGILSLLRKYWPDKAVPLVAYRRPLKIDKQTIKRNLLNLWMDLRIKLYMISKYFKFKTPENDIQHNIPIAVMYGEGIDLNRRSELFWHPDSNISPENILICFYSNSPLLPHEIVTSIENMGMHWVCLQRGKVKGRKVNIWSPGIELGRFACEINLYGLLKGSRKMALIEQWILSTMKHLLFLVSYWIVFYKKYGIKVSFEIGESDVENIIRAMASDFTGGILIGRQRSEYAYPKEFPIGHFPQHVFFGWNKRMIEYLEYPLNAVGNYIISGFCYDYIFEQNKEYSKRLREQLNGKGVKFTIALYDNTFGDHVHYSPQMVKIFYEKFIDWLFSDQELGIILKPKKIAFMEKHLPEVRELIEHAQKTGRCVIPPDSTGRFPSDIAFAADMAVGIGIASSVMEAVIGGSKGLMCDLPHFSSHIFYRDGYEKVVFDDVDRLLAALKRYRDDPHQEKELGDFSPWMDLLDPFRDGRAAERIGIYIRWCLEGFEKGMNKDEVIKQANDKYASMWGSDKVIQMNKSGISAKENILV